MSILLISPSLDGHIGAINKLKEIIDTDLSNNIKTILKINNVPNTTVNFKEFIFENCVSNVNTIEQEISNENIILIIYDFFSIEGAILSKKLKIPSVCSIPAIIFDNINDKFNDDLVTDRLSMIEKLFDVNLSTPRYVSDGFLLEADENIVWGFKNIYSHLYDIVYNPTYHFVGSKSMVKNIKDLSLRDNIVYCSFGTIVTTTILQNYEDRLIQIYENIINTCDYLKLTLILICPNVLFEKISNKNLVYEHFEYCDQIHYLKRAKLFITHGGGNSFNESLVCKCPMIVIPFFGDQFYTSSYVNKHNFGFGYGNIEDFLIDCLIDENVNNNNKHLSYGFYDKVKNIVNEITINSSVFLNCYNELNRQEIHRTILKNIDPNLLFNKGDLLFGTTKDRKHFDKTYDLDFEIGKKQNGNYITFDNLGLEYPVTIDQWNDLLKNYKLSELLENENLKNIHDELSDYKSYLSTKLNYNIEDTINAKDEELLKICCEGMTHFTNNNNKIHFVFKDFNKNDNIGTNIELSHMLKLIKKGKHLSHFIIWVYDELSGKYLITNIQNLINNNVILEFSNVVENRYIHQYTNITDNFQLLLNNIKKKYVVFNKIIIKNKHDIEQLLTNTIIKPIADIVCLQIIYPWSDALNKISNDIQIKNIFNVIREERTENNKIINLYCLTHENFLFKIELYPTILYSCQINDDIKGTKNQRTQLQNIIDAFEIAK